MRKELEYFRIDGAYGGNQEWFPDFSMRFGGCAAVTACESCIFFDLNRKTRLYPYNLEILTKKEFIRFGMQIRPYLKPRLSGIDSLELYMEGFGRFLADRGSSDIKMRPFHGNGKVGRAKEAIIGQIDKGMPVPCLMLKHGNALFKDLVWHWFTLAGYEVWGQSCAVKVVTYGSFRWFDLEELWDTSYRRKGGLVLYE